MGRLVVAVLVMLAACGGAPDPLADLNKPCVVTASCAIGLDCVDVGLGGHRCVLARPCPDFTAEIDPVGQPAFCVPRCGPVNRDVPPIPCAYGIPCEPNLHICWL